LGGGDCASWTGWGAVGVEKLGEKFAKCAEPGKQVGIYMLYAGVEGIWETYQSFIAIMPPIVPVS
jgi:hypothetical protein